MIRCFILYFCFCSFSAIQAYEEHVEDPHYVWFPASEVYVSEDGVYVDTKRGMMQLNVVEHDRVADRYKVLCSCLKYRGSDYDQALSFPPED